MEIEIVPYYDKEHLPLVQKWWREQLNLDMVPELTSEFGHVSYVDGKPVAVMFYYPCLGSKIAWMGFPISDRNAERGVRDAALDQLLEEVKVSIKKLGYTLIWTVSGVKPVQKRLEKHGYKVCDTDINQYWGRV